MMKEVDKKKSPRIDGRFVNKWVRQWMQDDADFIRRELIKMLREAGITIREA